MEARGAHERASSRFQIAGLNATLAQLHQRRQKAGEGFAAAGRSNQQYRASGFCFGQQFELVRARLPAAARKPACENVWQQWRRFEKVARGFHVTQRPATTIDPGTGSPFSVRVEAKSRLIGFNPAATTAAFTCASSWA